MLHFVQHDMALQRFSLVYGDLFSAPPPLCASALNIVFYPIFFPSVCATAASRGMSAAKFSSVSDWPPSDLARSGSGWISMIRPSAPAPSDAIASGGTKYHLPVPWLGSDITGR